MIDMLAMPNYTGSTGFGEKYVTKLLGQAGRLDVDDCIASIRYLISQGITEEGKQYLTGGSHGGFLIGHRESPFWT
jgi:dipeptidyl aminopeptidase/acylaminoacyl peptidase